VLHHHLDRHRLRALQRCEALIEIDAVFALDVKTDEG
jgi:hypothetical protein